MQAAYGFMAHAVVFLHLAFTLFVAFGGVLVLRWRRAAWVHLPAACWGGWVEFAGWVCPLTPVENRFRALAGLETYEGDFIGRTLLPVLYPEGLTRGAQVGLGVLVLVLNLAFYGWAFRGVLFSAKQST